MAEPTEAQKRRIQTFRESVRERAQSMVVSWIRYEQDRTQRELADGLLRVLHTIKGEASLMEFAGVANVAHALESAIEATAAAPADLAPDDADLILDGLDALPQLVAEGTAQTSATVSGLARDLEQLGTRLLPDIPTGGESTPAATPAREPEPAPASSPTPETAKPPSEGSSSTSSPELNLNALNTLSGKTVRVTPAQLDRMRDIIGELLLSKTRLSRSAGELHRGRLSSVTSNGASATSESLLDVVRVIEAQLRDDVLRVGNLVSGLEDLTRELRMVPIRTLFEQYPRLVRSLGRDLGKSVQMIFQEQHVELDREVLEAMQEPLLHLLRNAVDHGIESAEVRQHAGKPREGTISLRATILGSTLEIEMSDDGAGIDPETVRVRAIEKGVIEAQAAERMTRDQLLECLFAPGMSTRDTITQVSGRGVGLDVVQTTVQLLGGSLSVSSEPGRGTKFRIEVPVSVAISPVVLCVVGSARYAIPASSIMAILDANEFEECDSIHGPAIRFQDQLAPLISLYQLLGEAPGTGSRAAPRIVVARSGTGLVAFTGSTRHNQRDAILKPAGEFLRADHLVSAGVALEDGTVALVLNPQALTIRHTQGVMAAHTTGTQAPERKRTILVADDSPILLDLIAETLRGHGVQVVEACDGADALEKLHDHPEVDLLLTDVEMPRLSGLQLIEQLRAIKDRPRIPAIVVSTRGSDADKRAALDVGADAYLVKSDFSQEGLWKLVSRYLRGKSGQQ